ncbi:MAG: TrkH family potassium uptake protein [Armatimonadia bacterium]
MMHTDRETMSRNYRYLRQRLMIVGGYLGQILTGFGVLLVLPAVVGIIYREGRAAGAFLVTGAVTAVVGLLLRRFMGRGRLGTREAVLLCTGAWGVCSLVASIPMQAMLHHPYIDTLFESVSGLTTTGLTAFAGLDVVPKTVLFWRSTSQLLGGLGILSFFLLVSYQGNAAHRLFQTEASKATVPRPVPSMRRTVIITWMIYGLLLVFNIAVLVLLRVGLFDAINYGFTTTSTGGMSPHDMGLAYFRANGHPYALPIELATMIFMALSGLNYLLLYRAITGRVKVLFTGVEARRYWMLMLFGLALIMIESLSVPATWANLGQPTATGQIGGNVGYETWRLASFQVVSLVSTTGHVTLPLEHAFFGPAARQLFVFMLLLGGCAGSTAGGLKIVRAMVLNRSLRQEIRKLSHPEGATLPVVLEGHVLEARTVGSMAAMGSAWLIAGVVGGIIISLNSGHEALGSLSLSLSALSNVGPSLLPVGAVAALPAGSKVLLMVWMIAGRLEILPVLALLSARTWHE